MLCLYQIIPFVIKYCIFLFSLSTFIVVNFLDNLQLLAVVAGCSDDQNRGAASDSFSVVSAVAAAAALPPDADGLRLAPKRCPRPAASPAPSRGGGVLELAAPDIHSASLQPLARADSYRGAQCSILYLQSRGYNSYTSGTI